MAAHSGHSSQLFADANRRNAQVLATVVRCNLVKLHRPSHERDLMFNEGSSDYLREGYLAIQFGEECHSVACKCDYRETIFS